MFVAILLTAFIKLLIFLFTHCKHIYIVYITCSGCSYFHVYEYTNATMHSEHELGYDINFLDYLLFLNELYRVNNSIVWHSMCYTTCEEIEIWIQ